MLLLLYMCVKDDGRNIYWIMTENVDSDGDFQMKLTGQGVYIMHESNVSK